MRVCYWGTYDAGYVRNRVIIKGLRSQGIEVVECHVALWQQTADKVRTARRGLLSPRLWWRLTLAYARLLARYTRVGPYDVMMVGYAGHLDVFPARLLAWVARKPLVFDVYLSLHETVVEDRQLAGRHSPLAWLLYHVEKLGCTLADALLLDTEAHIRYFVGKYGLPQAKFHCIPVGAEDDIYAPQAEPPEQEGLTAIYFGQFIPLHGVEHIIRAAALLRSNPAIRLELIGSGQTYEEMRALAGSTEADNITWGPAWLEPEELCQRIARADVCLGIFGTSDKARRVVPTKAYVALAMGKALLTEDSPAAREMLVLGESALLCPPGDAGALARCLLTLQRERALRTTVARQGHALFRARFTPAAIGVQVGEILAALSQKAQVPGR